MNSKLVLTVGNGMMGDDGAGVLLAQMLTKAPVNGWQVLNGGSAPENVLHRVRELAPERVLVVDAAEMDLPPGTVRPIQDEWLEDPFFMTTHALPLSYLIQTLRTFIPQVDLLGIQPDVVAFGYPMTPAVRQAVAGIYAGLEAGRANWSEYS
jgi:hydrogenase 3 maturation protease